MLEPKASALAEWPSRVALDCMSSGFPQVNRRVLKLLHLLKLFIGILLKTEKVSIPKLLCNA